MADNTEKKVLVDVKILDNFIATKQNADEAKKALDKFLKSGEQNAEKQRELARRVADTNNQYKEAKKQLESAAKSEQLFNEATNKTVKTLGEMQRELSALKNTPFTGLDEKQIQAVKQQMADLTSDIQKYKTEIKGLNTSNFFQNLSSLGEVSSALTQITGQLSGALGIENESFKKLEESTTKLIGLTQAFGVVTEYLEKSKLKLLAANIKQIASSVALLVAKTREAAATRTATAAETVHTGVKGGATVATIALAAATWVLNAAIGFLLSPITLIIAAITILSVGVMALIGVFSSSAKAQKEAAKASKAYEEQQKQTAKAITQINNEEKNATNDRNNRLREEILEMKKNGATAKQIAKAKMKAEQDIRDITIKASQDRVKELKKEEEAGSAALAKQQKILDDLKKKKGEQNKKYLEQKKVVDELTASLNALKQAQIDETQVQTDSTIKSAEAIQNAADEQKKKYQENALKMLDMQKKLQDEQIKLTEVGMSQDFLKRKQWEEKKFNQSQDYEKKKLDMQKKFGQITQSEYDVQYSILDAQEKTFQQNQLKSLNSYYDEQRKQLASLLGQSVEMQINEIEERYKEASKVFEELNAVAQPIRLEGQSDEDFKKEMDKWESFQLQKSFYEIELEKKKAQEIETVRNNSLNKILSGIEDRSNKSYDEELAKFIDNEREKNRIEIEIANERLTSKKIALQKEVDAGRLSQQEMNREISKEEANLRLLLSKQNQIQLNSDLLAAEQSAREKYELRKAYLEKEAEIYKDNADKQKEIAKELADIEKEYLQSRIAAFEEWSGKTMELMNSINSLAKANEASELQEYEENNKQKKESLDRRLNARAISQENYDKQIAQLDADLDKKKAEIARKQAIREKLLRTFDIAINTAAAIMKNTAQLGLPAAIPVNIATEVLGAIQLATVSAEPLPKAARGRLIKGKSHLQGGEIIEAESGEAIINKRSTTMFAPLLSAINQAGGGVPFARPFSDGGYYARNSYQEKTKGITAEEMQTIISDLKIYTTIEDIRRGDIKYTEIQDISRY